MALKDKVPLGVALPHRSPEPIDLAAEKTHTLGAWGEAAHAAAAESA